MLVLNPQRTATPQRLRHRRMSRRALHCLGIIFAFLLSACGGAANRTSTDAIVPPDDLIVPGILTVGSDTTYAPQEYIDPTTQSATGFDIDLIKAIAQKMGLKTNIVNAKFDSILEGLNARRFDVVISAVTITPERQKKADFVSYFSAGESLLVQKGNPKNIKGLADLCGLAVGVQNGTVEQTDLQAASDVCKKAERAEIKILSLQDQTSLIQWLGQGRGVATYQDSPVTDYYTKQSASRFQMAGSVMNAAKEGIVVRKGDPTTFKAVQAAFNSIKADGTYRKLIDKWGLKSGLLASAASPAGQPAG